MCPTRHDMASNSDFDTSFNFSLLQFWYQYADSRCTLKKPSWNEKQGNKLELREWVSGQWGRGVILATSKPPKYGAKRSCCFSRMIILAIWALKAVRSCSNTQIFRVCSLLKSATVKQGLWLGHVCWRNCLLRDFLMKGRYPERVDLSWPLTLFLLRPLFFGHSSKSAKDTPTSPYGHCGSVLFHSW